MTNTSTGSAVIAMTCTAVGNVSRVPSQTNEGTTRTPPTPPPVSASDNARPRFSVNHRPNMLATAAFVSIANAGAIAR